MAMKAKIWQQLQRELKIWRIGALPGVVIIGLVVVARLMGALQQPEWMAFDLFLRWRPVEPIDDRVVIVGINEADIRRVGRYPIPDRDIAELITTLKTYQPAAIGLDIFRDLPVEPGHAELVRVFQTTPNLIAIDKVLPDRSGATVNPPPALPIEQVGFADALMDADGKLRRSLLGTFTAKGDFRFSLSIQLASIYLKQQGLALENGIIDRQAMRFGQAELTRFRPNTGSYVNADAGGNQILVNFRSGHDRFRILSMQDIQSGQVNPDWLRGQVVLVGVTAPSVKDIVSSTAIASDNPALIYGIEIQAHVISQLISTVLDSRPLIRVWADGWEYAWILIWGFLGISLGRWIHSPLQVLLGLAIASLALIGISYYLLIFGWWVPVVPALLTLVLNGAGLTTLLFYRYEQNLQIRLQERQLIIDHTFNAIHNGPLQSLAGILRQVQTQPTDAEELLPDLKQLNHDLRAVYESVRQESLGQGSSFYLSHDRQLDLQTPMHEILYEVYTSVLERNFHCFKTLKVKVVKFEPLDERHLNLEQKRGLCRFLEEALCNTGKHAIGVTRLEVLCMRNQDQNIIRVIDNGKGVHPTSQPVKNMGGLGTRQAENLAKQLSGKFQRYPRDPQGMVCELTWSVVRFWFWHF
jgi:CHASE2 domain-containing sensor protein/two-component sensor histidine kinase